MGCISAKDAPLSGRSIFSTIKQTNIIAFDHLFILISQTMRDIEALQADVVSRRINLLNISKAHLLSNPRLSDAFQLWTWGVSLCNKGNSKGQGVFYTLKNEVDSADQRITFNYHLGACAELRFLWFAVILREYIDAVQLAQQRLPGLRNKAKDIHDKLRTMKDQCDIYLNGLSQEERMETIANLEFNMSKINRNLLQSDDFNQKIIKFESELQDLQKRAQQFENDADQWGKKLYRDLDVVLVGTDTYRMRAKMNSLVLLYHPGKKRTQEEEQLYYSYKLERSKQKPKVVAEQENNKKFLFNQKWTGCSEVDSKWSEITFILEEHNEQMRQIKQIRNKIRNHLRTYNYVDDNLIVSWKIYSLSLLTEVKNTKIQITIIDSSAPKRIVNVNLPDFLEKQTQLFGEYFSLQRPSRLKYLKEYWNRLEIDKSWINGSFLKLQSFKSIHHQNQYNMMTNMAKNIYSFTSSQITYRSIYEKKYLKFEKESEELFQNGKKMFEEMEQLYEQYKIDKNVDKLMQQQLRSDDLILRKKQRLSKYE